MISRRLFVKAGLLAGAGLLLPWKGAVRLLLAKSLSVGALNPLSVLKYQMPLIVPPAMPKTGRVGAADYYEIAVRQFRQQILPAGMPMTTVWSYGSVSDPSCMNPRNVADRF